MKVSEESVQALILTVCGESFRELGPITPYLSGPDLIAFFSQFGFDDQYGPDFGARRRYAETRIRDCNGQLKIGQVIEAVVDRRRFIGTLFDAQRVVEYLNQFLVHDGYAIFDVGGIYRVRSSVQNTVSVGLSRSQLPSWPTIQEQIEKCEGKLAAGDYAGAVTNARTLVEAVLLAIEGDISGDEVPYDGDLTRLYKVVQARLNLGPDRKDLSDSLRKVLGGLSGIVSGLATLRNKASDAHPLVYRPESRHAKLAVNAAKTLVEFLSDTYEYQRSRAESAPSPVTEVQE